jgi:hypothetical protein
VAFDELAARARVVRQADSWRCLCELRRQSLRTGFAAEQAEMERTLGGFFVDPVSPQADGAAAASPHPADEPADTLRLSLGFVLAAARRWRDFSDTGDVPPTPVSAFT